MSERQPLCTIVASDAAAAALDRLRAENGEIMIHITAGGDDSGTPMCLPAGELGIGPRDLYVGTVHGVDLYEMRAHEDRHFRDGSFVLDIRPGTPVGFSLVPGDGQRFLIRDSVAASPRATPEGGSGIAD